MHAEGARPFAEPGKSRISPEARLGAVVPVLPVVAPLPARQIGEHAAGLDPRRDEAQHLEHGGVVEEDPAGPVHAVQGHDQTELPRPGRDVGTVGERHEPEPTLEPRDVLRLERARVYGGSDDERRGLRRLAEIRGVLLVDQLEHPSTPKLSEALHGCGEPLLTHPVVLGTRPDDALARAEQEERSGKTRRVGPELAVREHVARSAFGVDDRERGVEVAEEDLRAADRLGGACPHHQADPVGPLGGGGQLDLPGRPLLLTGPSEPGRAHEHAVTARSDLDVFRIDPVEVLERDDLEREAQPEDVEDGIAEVEARELHAGTLPQVPAQVGVYGRWSSRR
jgi:hypothetical protein